MKVLHRASKGAVFIWSRLWRSCWSLQKYYNKLRRDKLLFSDECTVNAKGHPRSKQISRSFFQTNRMNSFWVNLRHATSTAGDEFLRLCHWSIWLEFLFYINLSILSGKQSYSRSYINILRIQLLPELARRGGISFSSHFQLDGYWLILPSAFVAFYTSTFQIVRLIN